jgi:hypothetical protein
MAGFRLGSCALLWLCLAAAIAGLGIGLVFKVGFLLAASLLVVAATVAFGLHAGWPTHQYLWAPILLLAIVQVGFLGGLALRSLWSSGNRRGGS